MQQKSNKDSKNQSDNSVRIKKIAGTISAFLVVFFIITMIFWSILNTPGLAPGSDVPSHMFTSKYIGDYFQKYHSIPVINPYWYNGFEILHNPPGLTYLPLTLIYLLTNDIYLASRVFTWLLAILLSLSTFIVIRRKYSNLNAIIGALIYPLAPIVFMEARASYTRGLALIFFPISLYFIDRLLEEKDKVVRTSIILSFLIALSFLTHPMMGAVLIVFFSIYIFARLVLDTDLKKFRLVLWFQSIILGLGLVSWYLLPFFAEASGWTSISPEFYKELSLPINEQLVLISISLFVFSVIALIFRKNKQRLALFITVLVAMIFAMGDKVPILSKLPLVRSVYPLSILLFAIFLLTYIVATAIDFRSIAKRIFPKFASGHVFINLILILVIAGLPLLETAKIHRFRSLKSQAISSQDLRLANILKDYSSNGRTMPMKYPYSPHIIWAIPSYAKKPMVEGHYFSATPTGKQIAWLFDALDNNWNNYVFKKFELWNTRFVPVRTDLLNVYGKFINMLPSSGFSKVYSDSDFQLYFKDKPSNYLFSNKAKNLVIGKYAMVASAITDSTTQAGSIYVDDYELSTLKLFDGLILYGFSFRNKRKAEDLVRDYVASGGKVVIDMLGYDSPLEENPSFLGVTAYRNVSKKNIFLETSSDKEIQKHSIPNTFKLPTIYSESIDAVLNKKKFKEWRYVTYFGLDKTIATNSSNTVNQAIGYKNIYDKKVWFLGPNFFYHTFASHNPKQIQFLEKLISTGKRDQKSDYKITKQSIKPEIMKFAYNSSSSLSLFASFAYSPHWKAYLNGREINVVNMEDLIFLNLPAGSNEVEIRYESTPVHFYGKALTILALLFIGLLLFNERNNNILYGQIIKRRKPTK